MRYGIIIGFRRSDGIPVVVVGPEVPMPEQKDKMRELKCLPHHDEFARFEHLTSDAGLVTRKRLASKQEVEDAAQATEAAKAAGANLTPPASKPAKKPAGRKARGKAGKRTT